MTDTAAAIQVSNISTIASAAVVSPGQKILISLSSSGKSGGTGGDVLITTGQPGPAPGPCALGTYVQLGPESTVQGFLVQLLSINNLPAPGWGGLKLNGVEYDIQVGETKTTPQGSLTLLALTDLGACVALPGSTLPIPPVAPGPEPPWDLSGFFAFFQSLWEHIKWLLLQLLSPITSLLTWVGQIADYLLHLPDHLDTWISNLFGINPALPFFDELMKKVDVWVSARLGVDPTNPLLDEVAKKLAGWILSYLDASADKAPRKWR